jgi:hypothetical protein
MPGMGTNPRKLVVKPAVALAIALAAAPAAARVAKIVIDTRVSPAFDGASYGSVGQYETPAGRAFGELDPNDPHDTIIQDIRLAPRNARGMVEYTASFQLVKPIDMSRSSHLLWHDVPNRTAMGFPALPGLPAGAPTGLINPLLGYDFGPDFNPVDGSGVQTVVPPRIRRVIAMKAPRVDADGNELGGVPVVLRDAPLGTYLGWNITAAGFHKGRICNYAGGMISFAKTKAERLANEDPRPSLEERCGDHAGYVAAVKAAACNALASGFLLEKDAKALIAAPTPATC